MWTRPRIGTPTNLRTILLVGVTLCQGVVYGQSPDPRSIPGWENILALKAEGERTGLAVFPALFDGDQPVEILDPAGFHLYLTDADSPREEHVYPAGKLIQPPSGRWRAWVQGEATMTPFTDLLILGSSLPPGSKSVRPMPVIPAGRVIIPPDVAVEPQLQLRVLYAGGDPSAGKLRHELSRRRQLAELGEGILMPKGLVVAGLWDPIRERYTALSRPFRVIAGDTIAAPLERPDGSSAHLVVYAERASDARASAMSGVLLTVTQRGVTQEPEVAVTTPWGTYALWYDLVAGSARVTGGNDQLRLQVMSIELEGGTIARLQGTLIRLTHSEEITEQGSGRR